MDCKTVFSFDAPDLSSCSKRLYTGTYITLHDLLDRCPEPQWVSYEGSWQANKECKGSLLRQIYFADLYQGLCVFVPSASGPVKK